MKIELEIKDFKDGRDKSSRFGVSVLDFTGGEVGAYQASTFGSSPLEVLRKAVILIEGRTGKHFKDFS